MDVKNGNVVYGLVNDRFYIGVYEHNLGMVIKTLVLIPIEDKENKNNILIKVVNPNILNINPRRLPEIKLEKFTFYYDLTRLAEKGDEVSSKFIEYYKQSLDEIYNPTKPKSKNDDKVENDKSTVDNVVNINEK